MFSAVDLHRLPLDHGGADGVGAALRLRPGDTRLQRHLLRLAQEGRAAHRVEDQAVAVGQQHHAAGIGHHGRQGVEFGTDDAPQMVAYLPPFLQPGVVGAVGAKPFVHVETSATAAPGTGDNVGYPAGGVVPVVEEQSARLFGIAWQGADVRHSGNSSQPLVIGRRVVQRTTVALRDTFALRRP